MKKKLLWFMIGSVCATIAAVFIGAFKVANAEPPNVFEPYFKAAITGICFNIILAFVYFSKR